MDMCRVRDFPRKDVQRLGCVAWKDMSRVSCVPWHTLRGTAVVFPVWCGVQWTCGGVLLVYCGVCHVCELHVCERNEFM
jgi:hypothetical protein